MSVPGSLAAVLPADTATTWETIAPALPKDLYLVGGTALAVHLRHRVSRDLDFFYHEELLDLDELTRTLQRLGPFAVSNRSPGTLNGVFSETKIQFLHARRQHPLEPTSSVAGINIAGLSDILAMKLKVIGDRGELRDYFDLMAIEQMAERTVEEGLALYLARYGEPAEAYNVKHIVRALGYLEDVDEDEMLPVAKADISAYWRHRQPEIIRNLARFPLQATQAQAGRTSRRTVAPRPSGGSDAPFGAGRSVEEPSSGRAHPSAAANVTQSAGGSVWVEEYHRGDGTRVRGHWRHR